MRFEEHKGFKGVEGFSMNFLGLYEALQSLQVKFSGIADVVRGILRTFHCF